MKISPPTMIQAVATGAAFILALDVSLAVEPSNALEASSIKRCEDNVFGVAAIDPKLESPFFKTTKTSYHWEIVEDDDGNLENTFGGQISAEDLLRIEHTANCTSSHQGEHAMEFCDAVATADGVNLTISGGMPAYASNISVAINSKLEFKCCFSAVYPGPAGPLNWRVTKKAMKLKSADLKSGKRLRGWISVEFEEMDDFSKETHAYKIEGYIKPVIQTYQGEPPSKEGEQPGTGQSAIKPADKAPAEVQPPTQNKRADSTSKPVKTDAFYARDETLQNKVQLSDEMAAKLVEIIGGEPKPWARTISAAPRGFFVVGQKAYAFYGFIASDSSQGDLWDDPVLHRFWERLNRVEGNLESLKDFKP